MLNLFLITLLAFELIGLNSNVHGHLHLAPFDCTLMIVLLALVMLFPVLYALKSGVSVQPIRCGSMAGLISASFANLVYALHCPNDSMPHIMLFYGAAYIGLMLLGAFIGKFMLRW